MSNTESSSPSPSPQETIRSLILGGTITQFIGIAVRLGIPDILRSGSKGSNDIAGSCGTRPEETYRFLRCLSCVGILKEHAEQVFSLTPIGQLLRSDIPGSFDALAIMHSSVWSGEVFANLEHTLKTGENAFKKTYGCNMFEWFAKHSEAGALFGRAMSTYSSMEVPMVMDAYDFTGCRCIVDIGGGHGMLISAILNKIPDITGILLDTPEVVAHTQSSLKDSELASRLKLVAGDFFESVPRGGDVYLLKHVLHDWDDTRAKHILQNIASAMSPNAKLLVIEQGITPPGVPGPGKMLDLSMMALTEGGMERTPEQHRALFESVGLTYSQTIHTKGPISIFEAIYSL